MDLVAFRCDFPEFYDESVYPDSLLNFWAVIAENLVDICRWGDIYDQGVGLALAHFVALAVIDQTSQSRGATPGVNSGAITQKKVGDVSINYDATANNIAGAGQWNKTTYGTRYESLAALFGVGGVQL